MTAGQIIACAISTTAALMSIAALVATHRQAARNRREQAHAFPVRGGVITFPRRMSDAEVQELRERWQATYGKSGTAHLVKPIDQEQP